MLSLERMLHVFMRPAARAWYATQLDTWRFIPRPMDATEVTVPGHDADRVLLIGDGPAMGYGVVSHDLALPGALGRRLAHHTGRGAHVRVVAGARMLADALPGELDRLELRGTDAVVVTTGMGDACRLTSVRAWRRDVLATLETVTRGGRRDVRVFWIAIPPVAAIPVLRGWTARMVQRHSLRLNRRTATTLAAHPRAHFVPFTPDPHRDGERHRSAVTFGHWADLIAPEIARALDDQVHGPGTK